MRGRSRNHRDDHGSVQRQEQIDFVPKKEEEGHSQTLSRARGHAPAPQKSLQSSSASKADVLERFCLCEKLRAVPRSVPGFYSRSLKMDTSDGE